MRQMSNVNQIILSQQWNCQGRSHRVRYKMRKPFDVIVKGLNMNIGRERLAGLELFWDGVCSMVSEYPIARILDVTQ